MVAIGASFDRTPPWWLEQRKLVSPAELHLDLVWMHREGENQNFEPDEVAVALADGWMNELARPAPTGDEASSASLAVSSST